MSLLWAMGQSIGGRGVPGANSTNATALQSVPVSATVPTLNYCLVYNGTQWAPASCSASAPVASVFGRTGAVAAASGDYSAGQITGLGTAATQSTGTSGATVPLNNGANNESGATTFSAAGAASTPGVNITGSPYTGGTATTNFPQLYVNQGAAVTTLSTAGTEFGINAPSGFTGHLLNLFVNGGSTRFRVDYQGNVFAASGGTFAAVIHGGTTFTATGCGTVTSLTGGATGGSFLAQATSCTLVISTGLTATHGYICDAHDVTNPGDAFNESAYTTTTVTFTGTVSVGDQILFKCDQF